MLPYAKKANIMIFVINHITRKVETGFVKSARDLIGLGENEAIPGGRASVYLANNVLRLKNKKSLTVDKEYGINGNIIGATFYKSRTNESNVECELVFNKGKGFSKLLSMLHFGIDKNIVKKSGNKYCLNDPDVEDIKFSKKEFMEVCEENPKLVYKLYDLCLPKMRKLLNSTNVTLDETDNERVESYVSIMNMIGAA